MTQGTAHVSCASTVIDPPMLDLLRNPRSACGGGNSFNRYQGLALEAIPQPTIALEGPQKQGGFEGGYPGRFECQHGLCNEVSPPTVECCTSEVRAYIVPRGRILG